LFDEATSALDNYSKNKIKETMKELAQNKTIIIISHTLDLVKDCDNIIYIEDGQILESGNHNTLIEEKGKYYELINNSI
jgi:ABC-type multidrug transport system fused ATPase/permease subunit